MLAILLGIAMVTPVIASSGCNSVCQTPAPISHDLHNDLDELSNNLCEPLADSGTSVHCGDSALSPCSLIGSVTQAFALPEPSLSSGYLDAAPTLTFLYQNPLFRPPRQA